MALNIENATIGFDINNVETALKNLNTKVINATIDKMRSSMQEIKEYVDAAWVGASADQFKANMESDIAKISQALTNTYEVLKSEMYQIVNVMSENDENLITRRSE